jgi:hypothetical protein
MINKYTITPRKGVGPFFLGMTRSELGSLLLEKKMPWDESKGLWYCHDNAIQFEFDESGLLIFIGVTHSHTNEYEAEIFSINPFAVSSKRLFRILSKKMEVVTFIVMIGIYLKIL